MLQLRSASRACLRAFLLASAVLLGTFTNARADSVNLTFTGAVTHWNGVTPTGNSAGRYNWTVGTKTGPLANSLFPASVAWTFCIEQNQYISGGGTYAYTIQTSLQGLPNPPGGPINALKEAQLQALANLMANVSFYATYTAQTVQNTIWAVVAGTASGALFTAIETERLSGNAQVLRFYGLTNGGNQDQIILGDTGGNGFGGSIVPVPAGVVMAGMGVVCLGGFNILRRRRKLAAV